MDQSLSSGRGHVSVLSCFPPGVGKDVAVALVKPLRAGLGNPDTRSLLRTDSQVKWTMEVLCYGLTLPLDGDTVKHCVDVYTDWLMALASPRDSIPLPIIREPNLYVQKILRHLCSLFLPRSDQVSAVYLSLCQQVLCAVQSLARESAVMSRDTWETLLHFLLRINHVMLAPPTSAGSLSDQLSELSMAVLFEVWLLSCSRCFPSRSLWQTGRQMLSSWRHQPAMVEQWCRVVSALTSRLLLLTFGPSFPQFKVPDEDAALIPADMDDERVSHTWFRFLHLLSNPVDISRPTAPGSSPSSLEETSRGDSQLPNIFFRAMRGVSMLVDAFLGVAVADREPTEQLLSQAGITSRTNFRDRLPSLGVSVSKSPFRDRIPSYGLSRPRSGSAPPTPVNVLSLPTAPPSSTSSPPTHIKRLKAVNVSKATSKPPVVSSSQHPWRAPTCPPPFCPPLYSSPRPSPSPLRCNVDSLLHLFGSWLFDAALVSRDPGLPGDHCDVIGMSERWAAGQAEACGTICRILTCKKTAEDILPVYLSRFYLVLQQSLKVPEEACPPVLASILLNSTSLFCCDLRGVNVLLPTFISTLESVLLDRELLRFKGFVNQVDLRRGSILILLSLLPLPLHFPSVQSQMLLDRRLSGDHITAASFLSLKPRLISVLMGALQTETDTFNTQIILSAMLNLVQDSALLEAAGQIQQKTESQRRGAIPNKWSRGNVQSGSAGILWVQFVRLLTQRLSAQWRNDSALCLSVLEVLGGLAKVQVSVEENERRRALGLICSHIVFQCSRPPPLHSRDLHSIIVAAFYCLNVWLTQHPSMLHKQESLLEVLEIVELGISGSKSRQEQDVKCKEEKDFNPASLRVKDAAEATLSCVMQVSGAFPFLRILAVEGTQISCSPSSDSSVKKFRYFVVDGSVILAFLEQPQGPEPEPSLRVLIRGPSGCHTWTLQQHLQPREGRTHTQQKTLSPEPGAAAQEDAGIRCDITHQLLPESIDTVATVKADLSIPDLHETVSIEVQKQLECVRAALKRCRQVEAWPQVSKHPPVMTTNKLPPLATKFQTARLFLSHLGLLTPETLKDSGTGTVLPELVSLDSSLPGFTDELRRLDHLPSRNCDCAFVFYMRAGQKTAAEILNNVESSSSVTSHFLDFLLSLGWPVEAGHRQVLNTQRAEFPAVLGDSGGGVFNGEKFVLMYADALTEITFIIPSSTSSSSPQKSVRSKSLQGLFGLSPNSTPQPVSPSVDEMKSFPSVSSSVGSESKPLIIWVERFEDIDSFPLSDLLLEIKTETPTSVSNVQLIFIHPLKSGLYRLCFHGNLASKFNLIIPLVNGSVVSKRSLGFLVRETVINYSHRRRLESDSAPPPHVRRKQVISDIIARYRSRCSEPTFYSALFQDP
ncbi:ral GTPase-activating protein subunit beta-like [Notolabrus celidotus]|uniref:ral GTPase-activating protein subunit beta-like n=1 Tax=Notolabrus celidotus TaxID=1203425 RepID=UPI00149037D8|nr:ral GTPase-activating protein subunit beta-like [Notolabrus celidotus]